MSKSNNGKTAPARAKAVALRLATGGLIVAATVFVLPAYATPGSGFSSAPQSLAPFTDLDVKDRKSTRLNSSHRP